MLVVFVAFFGERWSKARAIAVSCGIFGLGAFVYALPILLQASLNWHLIDFNVTGLDGLLHHDTVFNFIVNLQSTILLSQYKFCVTIYRKNLSATF